MQLRRRNTCAARHSGRRGRSRAAGITATSPWQERLRPSCWDCSTPAWLAALQSTPPSMKTIWSATSRAKPISWVTPPSSCLRSPASSSRRGPRPTSSGSSATSVVEQHQLGVLQEPARSDACCDHRTTGPVGGRLSAADLSADPCRGDRCGLLDALHLDWGFDDVVQRGGIAGTG